MVLFYTYGTLHPTVVIILIRGLDVTSTPWVAVRDTLCLQIQNSHRVSKGRPLLLGHGVSVVEIEVVLCLSAVKENPDRASPD